MLGLRDPLGPCLEPTDPQHARSGVMGLDKVAQHGVGDHPKLGSPGIVIYCHILFSAFFWILMDLVEVQPIASDSHPKHLPVAHAKRHQKTTRLDETGPRPAGC